jgi:2-dehydro-3-deoxygluconokinase
MASMTTPEPAHITCVGEALIVLSADRGPLESAEFLARGAAGAEANVATTLVALGISASVITRVGNDGFGRFLTKHLAEAHVDTSAVIVDSTRPTGLYVKERGGGSAHPHDLPLGESRALYYRRGSAGGALTVEDLRRPEVQRVLSRTDLVHLSGITPALSDTARQAVAELVHGPHRCCFDLNYRQALWQSPSHAADVLADCVRASDIALMGMDEAAAAFGLGSPREIRNEFPEPEYLVVKNDSHHVTGFHKDDAVEVAALTVDVVEKIGAGDAFASGFLTGIVTGMETDRALRMGHICAAAALSSTDDAVKPAHDELERLLTLSEKDWATARFRKES